MKSWYAQRSNDSRLRKTASRCAPVFPVCWSIKVSTTWSMKLMLEEQFLQRSFLINLVTEKRSKTVRCQESVFFFTLFLFWFLYVFFTLHWDIATFMKTCPRTELFQNTLIHVLFLLFIPDLVTTDFFFIPNYTRNKWTNCVQIIEVTRRVKGIALNVGYVTWKSFLV